MLSAATSTSPLLGPAQDAPTSPRSSDFVLLTTAAAAEARPATNESERPHLDRFTRSVLPRPRFLPVLQGAAVLDLISTVVLALRVPIKALPPSTVAINLARSVVVGSVVSSARVRELGPVILAQLAVTALVLLFRLNELVQTNAAFSPPSARAPTFLNPTTEWYLASFAFSSLHYVLFAAFIGFTRERNPLAGRMKRSSTWGEQRWEGTQVPVDTRATSVTGSVSSDGDRGNASSFSHRGSDIRDASVHSDNGDEEDATGASDRDLHDFSSDSDFDDENDIVDVPRRYHGGGLTAATSTLRNRASYASLASTTGHPGAESSTSPRKRTTSGLGVVRNYGSINSLAGI
ncbi:hypothetical protein JCM10908_005308 [Rhodotorula pacifica]|uniref:uncharacterized protein n=1 Tax=Rhodotorula pacifica TaxID=1495444 RepID=UPI00316B9A10